MTAQASSLRRIKNIEKILNMRVVNNPEAFTNDLKLGERRQLRVVSSACCSEAAFLAQAFGEDFLDKEITLEQFLEAFTVNLPNS